MNNCFQMFSKHIHYSNTYFQIKHGLTIPVHIKAAAVYPYVNISTEALNFGKVFVGECKEMSFLLKNK